MKTTFPVLFAALSLAAPTALALPIGADAPKFDTRDFKGAEQSLAANQGKWVVLEWFNTGCPFVKKHYKSGNMQKLQARYKDKGVVWYTIVSSAEGKQGFMSDAEAQKIYKDWKLASSSMILDPKGKIGHEYGAKTTPNMYVIDPEGKLVYEGAIDDHASTEIEDIAKSKNYVAQALDLGMAGKPIPAKERDTTPYGCSVKY